MSVVAYSDFTSNSSDYVLSKAGLVSTELSLPELHYFARRTQNCHFSSFSRNHEMVSTHAHWGKRLRTIGAQSWDSENAQRNLEIAQILRLCGTYIPHQY